MSAEPLGRIVRVEGQVVGLSPDDGVLVVDFDGQDGVGRAVFDLLDGDPFAAGKDGSFSNYHDVRGPALFSQPGGGAAVEGRHLADQLAVVLAVPGFVQVKPLIELSGLKVGQEVDPPTQQRLAVGIGAGRGRKALVHVVIVVHRQGDPLQVVHRGCPPGRGTCLLNRRFQEGDYAGDAPVLLVEKQGEPVAFHFGCQQSSQLVERRHHLPHVLLLAQEPKDTDQFLPEGPGGFRVPRLNHQL